MCNSGAAKGSYEIKGGEEMRKGYKVAIGLWVVVISFIGLVMLLGKSEVESPKTQKPKVEETGYFDLAMTLNWDGYVFTLVNNSGRDWTDITFEINEGLIASGYIMKVKRIAAGSKVTLRAKQFAKPDGLIFNPATHKPTKFSVLCDVEGSSKKGFWLGSLG